MGGSPPRCEGGFDVAAKKKATKKKAVRKKATKKKGDLVDSIEKELKDLSRDLERRLKPLQKQVGIAERKAGSATAKLLRQARAQLNKISIAGESDLKKFLRKQRRQISKGLSETEKAVRPKRKKKAGARKKVAAK